MTVIDIIKLILQGDK